MVHTVAQWAEQSLQKLLHPEVLSVHLYATSVFEIVKVLKVISSGVSVDPKSHDRWPDKKREKVETPVEAWAHEERGKARGWAGGQESQGLPVPQQHVMDSLCTS